MPLPKTHLASLQPYVRLHREDLDSLRRLRAQLAAEIERRQAGKWRDPNPKPDGIPGMVAELELVDRKIARHEQLLAFVRDERNLEPLAELLADRELAAVAARDPRAFARKRGVHLPDGADVTLAVRNDRIHVRVSGADDLAPFVLSWTTDGFDPPPGDRPPEDPRRQRAERAPATRRTSGAGTSRPATKRAGRPSSRGDRPPAT